jgi:hypothetical protein
MLRSCCRLGVSGRCLPATLIIGVCATLTAAQQTPKPPPSPAPRVILLPPKVVAGAQATLAVFDSQGRLLSNIEVNLTGGQKVTTDATGRALFKAPGVPGSLIAKTTRAGITSSTRVVASENPDPQMTSPGPSGSAKVVSYPHVMAIHDRFALEGAGFRGAADSNHVSLNGDPCLVVAASPVSLVVLPGPSVPVGDVTLDVTVAGTEAGQFPVSAVLLEISGPSEAVNAGSFGKLFVRARGSTEPLMLEVRNGSPGVIQLSKGNIQRIKTSGGDENIAPVEVKFVSGGNYSVSARLIPAW